MSTFKGNLEKKGYEIRVFKEDQGYQIEYSKDGFESKKVKIYGSRYKFLESFESRFSPDELKPFLV